MENQPSIMARKTKEEALATRCQLLDAAQSVFCERGVSHTSLHEVATAAGLTRGAVYWHFENKADLLAALWERASLPIDTTLEEIDQKFANDPLARIFHRTMTIIQRIATEDDARALMSIILLKCEYVLETEAVRLHLVEAREQCLSKSAADFQAAIDAGQLPATVDPHTAAFGTFAIFDGTCFHWLMAPERFDLVQLAEQTFRAYLDGLKCMGNCDATQAS
ncbi:TetR family transcriptional regulator [Uliginosibacterium sp. H3]|uniref:TetR family transcriptional regulator n=1 Tax=Uliginosibacterium silvisoli TaxID=3114758 RepID=A0ABU6K6X9_9RHOO|nr:TetR family transcriptional regulator [Uliginosibacterium sp. H3]